MSLVYRYRHPPLGIAGEELYVRLQYKNSNLYKNPAYIAGQLVSIEAFP
jgi:hypothetical protein